VILYPLKFSHTLWSKIIASRQLRPILPEDGARDTVRNVIILECCILIGQRGKFIWSAVVIITLYLDIFRILNRSCFYFCHTPPCSFRIDVKVASDVRMTSDFNGNWKAPCTFGLFYLQCDHEFGGSLYMLSGPDVLEVFKLRCPR
jgi:hypothetical protein